MSDSSSLYTVLFIFTFHSKMPNQRKIVVTVRSARCSTKSILTFGSLFFLVAALFFGVKVTRLSSDLEKKGRSSDLFSPVYAWSYWIIGYPILIGIWIATFGIFCLILFGIECYAIIDFMPNLKISIKALKIGACHNSVLWENCYFNVSLFGFFILLAALVVLHSVWCVICCLGSFICATDVQPRAEDGEQQVPQPTAPQDLMLMEENPPPYNPDVQASTDNLQGNATIAYNSGPPMDPTMQGNIQATAPPIYPTMQENMEPIQSNAIPVIQVTSGEKNTV